MRRREENVRDKDPPRGSVERTHVDVEHEADRQQFARELDILKFQSQVWSQSSNKNDDPYRMNSRVRNPSQQNNSLQQDTNVSTQIPSSKPKLTSPTRTSLTSTPSLPPEEASAEAAVEAVEATHTMAMNEILRAEVKQMNEMNQRLLQTLEHVSMHNQISNYNAKSSSTPTTESDIHIVNSRDDRRIQNKKSLRRSISHKDNSRSSSYYQFKDNYEHSHDKRLPGRSMSSQSNYEFHESREDQRRRKQLNQQRMQRSDVLGVSQERRERSHSRSTLHKSRPKSQLLDTIVTSSHHNSVTPSSTHDIGSVSDYHSNHEDVDASFYRHENDPDDLDTGESAASFSSASTFGADDRRDNFKVKNDRRHHHSQQHTDYRPYRDPHARRATHRSGHGRRNKSQDSYRQDFSSHSHDKYKSTSRSRSPKRNEMTSNHDRYNAREDRRKENSRYSSQSRSNSPTHFEENDGGRQIQERRRRRHHKYNEALQEQLGQKEDFSPASRRQKNHMPEESLTKIQSEHIQRQRHRSQAASSSHSRDSDHDGMTLSNHKNRRGGRSSRNHQTSRPKRDTSSNRTRNLSPICQNNTSKIKRNWKRQTQRKNRNDDVEDSRGRGRGRSSSLGSQRNSLDCDKAHERKSTDKVRKRHVRKERRKSGTHRGRSSDSQESYNTTTDDEMLSKRRSRSRNRNKSHRRRKEHAKDSSSPSGDSNTAKRHKKEKLRKSCSEKELKFSDSKEGSKKIQDDKHIPKKAKKSEVITAANVFDKEKRNRPSTAKELEKAMKKSNLWKKLKKDPAFLGAELKWKSNSTGSINDKSEKKEKRKKDYDDLCKSEHILLNKYGKQELKKKKLKSLLSQSEHYSKIEYDSYGGNKKASLKEKDRKKKGKKDVLAQSAHPTMSRQGTNKETIPSFSRKEMDKSTSVSTHHSSVDYTSVFSPSSFPLLAPVSTISKTRMVHLASSRNMLLQDLHNDYQSMSKLNQLEKDRDAEAVKQAQTKQRQAQRALELQRKQQEDEEHRMRIHLRKELERVKEEYIEIRIGHDTEREALRADVRRKKELMLNAHISAIGTPGMRQYEEEEVTEDLKEERTLLQTEYDTLKRDVEEYGRLVVEANEEKEALEEAKEQIAQALTNAQEEINFMEVVTKDDKIYSDVDAHVDDDSDASDDKHNDKNEGRPALLARKAREQEVLQTTMVKVENVLKHAKAFEAEGRVKEVFRKHMYKCLEAVNLSYDFDFLLFQDVEGMIRQCEEDLGAEFLGAAPAFNEPEIDIHEGLEEGSANEGSQDRTVDSGSPAMDTEVDTVDAMETMELMRFTQEARLLASEVSTSIATLLQEARISSLYENRYVLVSVFNFLDKDKGGSIDFEEFQLGMKLLNKRLSPRAQFDNDNGNYDAATLFAMLDKDGSGDIDLSEFECFLKQK